METQIFHHAKIQSSKNPLKETKVLQDIITLQLISSFNTSQNISSFKNPDIKIDLLLPRGQNLLSYYTLDNESKHNILAMVGKANKGCVTLWPCHNLHLQVS
jgi:hypothetical protein